MIKQYSGLERRRFKRINVDFIVIYRVHKPLEVILVVGAKEVNALMLDLSEDGMTLITDYSIPRKTILNMRFTLINPYVASDRKIRKIELSGEVLNHIPLVRREHRLGIQFSDISQENRSAIGEMVKLAAGR